jgi:hypothetical protein
MGVQYPQMTQRKNPGRQDEMSWLQSLASAAAAAFVMLLVAAIAGFLLWAFMR